MVQSWLKLIDRSDAKPGVSWAAQSRTGCRSKARILSSWSSTSRPQRRLESRSRIRSWRSPMRNLNKPTQFFLGAGGAKSWLRGLPRRALTSIGNTNPEIHSRLFRKYVALFVAVVCIALVVNGAFQIWFFDQQNNAALIRIQNEQAQAAGAKIGRFIKEIDGQLGWTVQLPWTEGTAPQRRLDAWRLFRQVPAISELVQVDPAGREQIHVSRRAPDVMASGADFSKDPRFVEAMAHKSYYGEVYFRNDSEPYMS